MRPISNIFIFTIIIFMNYSFVVFLPESKEPVLPSISRIEESHYKRKLVVVPGMAHEYRHGYQHVIPK